MAYATNATVSKIRWGFGVTSQDMGSSLEMGRYATVLRRRWRTVAIFGVLGLLLAGGYLAAKPRMANASALVNINVISAEPFNNTRNPSGLIDQQTEVQTARSSAVVTRTAVALGNGVTKRQVRQNLQVVLLANATVLRITYNAPTVRQAIDGADEAARQFLTYRGELAAQKLTTITDQLTERRDLLRNDLLRVNGDLSKARSGSNAAIQAESDRQLLNLELDSLVGQINSINGIDTTGGTVLTSARDAGAFVTPRRGTMLAIGLLGGILVGLVAAFVRNATDRRLFDGADIRAAGGSDVLARVRAREETLPAHADDLDAIRSVWERLLTTLPAKDPVLAVADVSSTTLPSELPLNLALALCETGARVQVVLLEHPSSTVSQVAGHLGLRRSGSLGDIAHFESSGHPGLVVSVVGRQGSESDTADQIKVLLRSPERDVDMTVLAVAPTASRSARLAAARLAHSVVVVVTERSTRSGTVRELSAELRAVGTEVAGTVVLPKGRRLADATTLPHDDLDGPATGAPSAGAAGGSRWSGRRAEPGRDARHGAGHSAAASSRGGAGSGRPAKRS